MKDQWTKYFIIGLFGLTIELLIGSRSLLAQQIPAAYEEETSVISVEDVKPLETPSGTPQDLGQIDGLGDSQWSWGVGGEAPTTSENSQGESGTSSRPQSIYQINDKSKKDAPAADWQQDNEQWQTINRGDFNSPSSKIPFAKF